MRKATAVNLVTGVLLLAVIAVPIVYVGSWWWSSAEPAQPVVQSEAPVSEIVEASDPATKQKPTNEQQQAKARERVIKPWKMALSKSGAVNG